MVGEPFNKRSVPCAFGIKIGLYFHKRNLFCLPRQERFFLAFWAKYRANHRKTGFGAVDWLLRSPFSCVQQYNGPIISYHNSKNYLNMVK